ncbi:MAG: hypothetical protein R2855_11955 [Thermomicrobiales bacterium]
MGARQGLSCAGQYPMGVMSGLSSSGLTIGSVGSIARVAASGFVEFGIRPGHHRAEFVEGKGVAAEAEAGLAVDDGAAGGDEDGEGDDEEDGRQDDEGGGGEEDVGGAFDAGVDGVGVRDGHEERARVVRREAAVGCGWIGLLRRQVRKRCHLSPPQVWTSVKQIGFDARSQARLHSLAQERVRTRSDGFSQRRLIVGPR